MEKEVQTEKELKQRKFMLVAPLLVLPFLIMGFWALGGGRGADATDQDQKSGLNMALPAAANEKGEGLNKMAMYSQAIQDSILRAKQLQDDPYAQMPDTVSGRQDEMRPYPSNDRGINSIGSYGGRAYNDDREAKVYERLEQLNRSLTAPEERVQDQAPSKRSNGSEGVNSADIDRLEKMMHAVQSGNGEDPEMTQIDGMLERILDIQHPERVREKIKTDSEKHRGQVFTVSNLPPENIYSILERPASKRDTPQDRRSTFHSLPEKKGDVQSENSITAVIHENQTLVNGSVVKLRLTGDIYVNGHLIPEDSFVYGIAQLSGERLVIKIAGLRHKNSLFPVNLSVYDMDGLDGIFIPGAISRSVAKESGDQALQGISLGGGLDPTLSAQAMNVGLEATKSFLSRKVKLVRVNLKAGYKVLLKDENQKNNK